MLAWEPVVEARALHARGWTISAIARHLQINRRTVRRYLSGEVGVGERRPAGPDEFERFAGYARQRLVDDPHLWALDAARRAARAGLPGVVPVADPGAARAGAAAALRAVPGGEGPGPGDHRPSGRSGDAVGLARAARPARALGVGQDGASAGRGAGAFVAVARGAGLV